MSEIVLKKISYGQLQENTWLTGNDCYGMAAFVDENVRNTFLQSPNNNQPDKTAILLALDGDVIVGRHLLYGTTIKTGQGNIMAQSSGSTEVHESQRGKGIGSKINKWTLNNDEYPVYICSLLSPACLRIMEKKENACTIFEFPELVKIINMEAAFACRGMKGVPLKICKGLCNLFLGIFNIPTKVKVSKLKKKYSLKKEKDIPEWAGDMCMNDGHKYAEVHDNAWLRWNLNYNLTGKLQDKQSFYSIYKGEKPVGFFFTKERLRDDVSSEMIIGTLCEWASVDKELTETDINLLAFSTFDKKCYYMRTVTNNPKTCNDMQGYWFRKHGEMQMGFKDKLGQYPDMAEMANWRIRFGCCNSILF
jgi:hypothetical protein